MIVLISTNDTVFSSHLEKMLTETGTYKTVMNTVQAAVMSMVHEHQPDLIICSHEPPAFDGISLTTSLRGKVRVPVLMAAKNWSEDLVKAAIEAGVAELITMYPNRRELVLAILKANTRMEYSEQLNNRLTDLNQRLADRKIIEKAKGILMAKHHMDEETAFKSMRGEAMQRRINMSKLAAIIIDSNTTTVSHQG